MWLEDEGGEKCETEWGGGGSWSGQDMRGQRVWGECCEERVRGGEETRLGGGGGSEVLQRRQGGEVRCDPRGFMAEENVGSE
eukprot:757099-Hanusia_phi.AAC.5